MLGWYNQSASERKRAEFRMCASVSQKSVDPDSDVWE